MFSIIPFPLFTLSYVDESSMKTSTYIKCNYDNEKMQRVRTVTWYNIFAYYVIWKYF